MAKATPPYKQSMRQSGIINISWNKRYLFIPWCSSYFNAFSNTIYCVISFAGYASLVWVASYTPQHSWVAVHTSPTLEEIAHLAYLAIFTVSAHQATLHFSASLAKLGCWVQEKSLIATQANRRNLAIGTSCEQIRTKMARISYQDIAITATFTNRWTWARFAERHNLVTRRTAQTSAQKIVAFIAKRTDCIWWAHYASIHGIRTSRTWTRRQEKSGIAVQALSG